MHTKQLHKATLFRVAGLAMALMATIAFISGCGRSFASAERVVKAEAGKLTVADASGLHEETHEVAPDAEVILDGQPAALDELGSGDAVKLTTEKREDGTEVVKKNEAQSKEEWEADKPASDPLIDQPVAPGGPSTDLPAGDIPEIPSGLHDPAQRETLPQSDEPIEPEEGARQADPTAETDSALDDLLFAGKIGSLGDNQFVIRDDTDVEVTFVVNDDTKFTLDGKEATFGDMMIDHSVNVTAEKDGDNYVAKMVDATGNPIE
jgi:hypothetical protein